MKKAIFFDIDGTIATEDSRGIIPESTKRAIRQARQNGSLTFINTGRTVFNLSRELRDIGFDGYLCGCGTYIEYGGEVLLHNKLDEAFCRRIAEIIRECRATPVYERSDCLFFDDDAEEVPALKYFRETFVAGGIPLDRRASEEHFSFDKFVIWSSENTDMEMFRREVSPYFSIIDRNGGFYENVPLGFTKATAIHMILEKLGIPLENAYAVGDSMNDLPMLEAVPNSIAMGGAEQLYPYVSFVTKPIGEDGIEYALRHFGII